MTDLPKNIMNDTVEAVRSAGKILKDYFGKDLEYILKDESYATKADLESEKCLIKALGKILPQASFLAEESGETAKSRYCWVIDPLDGTTNFSRGISYFAMSVALTVDDIPVVGVVYNPVKNEMFYGQKGAGAYCNGLSIKVSSDDKELVDGVIAVSFSYKTNDDYQRIWDSCRLIRSNAQTMRHFGAAALDLAYVASGRLDGVFFESLNWWDVAAGLCIADAAGAKIASFEGQKVIKGFDSCIVAPNKINQKMIDLLKKC